MRQRSFSRFVFLLSWLSLLFNPAFTFAQKKPAQPNPRQILDRGVAAMGGNEKLKAITSRQVFASIKRMRDGATGSLEIATRQPGNYFMRIDWGNNAEQVACENFTCYEWKSGEELRTLQKEELKLRIVEAVYKSGFWYSPYKQRWRWWDFNNQDIFRTPWFDLPKIDDPQYLGDEQIQGKTAQIIGFQLSDTTSAKLSFDLESGHLLAETLVFGHRQERWEYSDFRALNGIVEPHRAQLLIGAETYEIQFSRILHNQTLDAQKFALPPSPQSNLPSITELIGKARTNQEKIVKSYDQFSYQMEITFQDSESHEDSQTQMTTTEEFIRNQTFEVQFYRGLPVKVKTKDDHDNPHFSLKDMLLLRASDPDELKLRRIKSQKKDIDYWYKTRAELGIKISPEKGLEKVEGAWGKDILSFLKYAQFRNLKRGNHEQRSAFILDFFPAPEGKYGKENFVKKFGGTIWIDERTAFVMRLEAYDADKQKDGSVMLRRIFGATLREQVRICDDLWLPSFAKRGTQFGVFNSNDFIEIVYTKYTRNGKPLACDPNGRLITQ
jgi:hypothetical protein